MTTSCIGLRTRPTTTRGRLFSGRGNDHQTPRSDAPGQLTPLPLAKPAVGGATEKLSAGAFAAAGLPAFGAVISKTAPATTPAAPTPKATVAQSAEMPASRLASTEGLSEHAVAGQAALASDFFETV